MKSRNLQALQLGRPLGYFIFSLMALLGDPNPSIRQRVSAANPGSVAGGILAPVQVLQLPAISVDYI